MATRYLQLDWKSSNLYEYSKTEKEDFKEETSSKGNVSYRKYENKGITGELLNVGVKDSNIGPQLKLAFKTPNGDTVVTQFNLFDQKGQVDNTYPESIIVHLGNLVKGQSYTMYPYNLDAATQKKYDETTEGREVRVKYYDKRAVSFKIDGVKVKSFLTYAEGQATSVPRLTWKKKMIGGEEKNRPSAVSIEAKDDFLNEALTAAVTGHLAYESTGSSTSSTSATTAEAKTVVHQAKPISPQEAFRDAPADSHDDLPF